MPCFYAPSLNKNNLKIEINGSEHHHISNVFRKKTGDELLLTNGVGLLAKGRIIELNRENVIIQISEIIEQPVSFPNIAVAVPLLKNKHDHMIIEKLTELGIKDFYPIITERTVRKPSKNTLDKFTKIAISAIKQCDNAYLPRIHEVTKLPELLRYLKENDILAIAAIEVGERQLISKVGGLQNSVCIIIGPEGGFEASEIELMISENVIPVTLGNHIVRAETAAITAVSQLLGVYLENDPSYY